jgi:hypothetical protein
MNVLAVLCLSKGRLYCGIQLSNFLISYINIDNVVRLHIKMRFHYKMPGKNLLSLKFLCNLSRYESDVTINDDNTNVSSLKYGYLESIFVTFLLQ